MKILCVMRNLNLRLLNFNYRVRWLGGDFATSFVVDRTAEELWFVIVDGCEFWEKTKTFLVSSSLVALEETTLRKQRKVVECESF